MRTCGTRRTRSSASRSTARTLPSCDTDVAFELLSRGPLEDRVAKALDLFEPRVLALAALRAADSNAERSRKRGLERLKSMRSKLEALARDEKDPAIAAKLKEA